MLGDEGAAGIGDAKEVVAAKLEGRAVPPLHQPALGQRHAGRMIVASCTGDKVGTVLFAPAELIDAERVLEDMQLAHAAAPICRVVPL